MQQFLPAFARQLAHKKAFKKTVHVHAQTRTTSPDRHRAILALQLNGSKRWLVDDGGMLKY